MFSAARLSDAAYHVNNLLSPVRFAEALSEVPARALVVEVAPHALLSAVLKRALPLAGHAPLVRKDHPQPLHHLLAAIGRYDTLHRYIIRVCMSSFNVYA